MSERTPTSPSLHAAPVQFVPPAEPPAPAVPLRARARAFWRSGDLFVWATASGVAFALLMMGGLLLLIMVKGLGAFWPADIWELRLADGRTMIGQVMDRETIRHTGSPDRPEGRSRTRVRVGNRDVFASDFLWIEDDAVIARSRPADLVLFERREWGPLVGRLRAIVREDREGDRTIAEGAEAWAALPATLERARRLHARIRLIEQDEIGAINHRLDRLRLEQRALELRSGSDPGGGSAAREGLAAAVAAQDAAYAEADVRLAALMEEAGRARLAVVLSDGRELAVPVAQVLDAVRPNEMSRPAKAAAYVGNLWDFLSGEPRESNTEGGIFPAIFGTVMMVFIMTIVVVPFGVMAALYLREYATQGLFVRIVRIAVNNLAGVPSIVFGVFGLGFFVYLAGGTIDRLFYPEALPSPSFGTGGILWASLTLALLTVPVVIVATEEGLAAVPRDVREGSIALGATKLETLWKVMLPSALPGILTGVILAMARAAGEVAPLMLTGVVKLAPSLPLDGVPPFLHLERKFMHLGFHIYDVGFQSPNVEAAKPMVFMTTLTLILVVVVLNLLAVVIRNRLRKRYGGSVL